MSKGRKMLDLTGRKFGRLTVKGRANNNPSYVHVNVSAAIPLQLEREA